MSSQLAQYLTTIKNANHESDVRVRLYDQQALADELQQVLFERIVDEAVDLVELCGIDPFDAADQAASRHGYDEFDAVLERVRDEVDSDLGSGP